MPTVIDFTNRIVATRKSSGKLAVSARLILARRARAFAIMSRQAGGAINLCPANFEGEKMKKAVLLISAIVIASLAAWTAAGAQSSEEAAVRKALEHYLQGHATGKADEHRKAFHTEMRMSFLRDGKLNHRTLEEYLSGSTGKPADDEAKRKRWIESVDITGNAAIAKLVLDYPSARITDYMSLLKVDGEWKVVGKIFHVEPKSKP
jgi:hypothetical protein